jgi:hypothetical protein
VSGAACCGCSDGRRIGVFRDEAAAGKVIAEADEATKAASAAHGAWRDTGNIVKKAEALAEAGEFAKAVKFADTAKFRAETGLAQAKSQAGTGNPGYLK